MKKQKLPPFGDHEALSKMKEAMVKQGQDQEQDKERKMRGKIFKVRAQYTVTEECDKTFEVIAFDEDDAEEVACEKVYAEENADDDSVDIRILEVREQGKGSDDQKTLEMFPNAVPECDKSK